MIISASKAPFLTESYRPLYHQEKDVLRNIYRDMQAVNPGLKRSKLLEQLTQSKKTPCKIHTHSQHKKMDKVLDRWMKSTGLGYSMGAIISGGSDGLKG